MLNIKSGELTLNIFKKLKCKTTERDFHAIQPIILKALESIYIQSRHDQKVGIKYTFRKDGSLSYNA